MFGWIVGIAVAVALAAFIFFALRRRGAAFTLPQAREIFRRQREQLEAKFLTLASQSGKPRGLDWLRCDFSNDFALARQRQTGQLHAFVGVEISFEAIEGGGMEDNPNVGKLRAATAVFLQDGPRWTTEGRAIFNLGPAEAIEHFGHELEPVD